ncbi:MAG: hypothetical protein EXR47_00040 [Dehalococcoidia bacterium]|nr:hypothetical protein [Dehalococcoidia bacterium]
MESLRQMEPAIAELERVGSPREVAAALLLGKATGALHFDFGISAELKKAQEWLGSRGFTVAAQKDSGGAPILSVKTPANITAIVSKQTAATLESPRVARSLAGWAAVQQLVAGGKYAVTKGDKDVATDVPWYLLAETLERQAERSGVGVQRYKGLGEMNAEQLWETTMDPERRTLLRVSMEDANAATDEFNRLMGAEVAPRKEFIFAHAKQVKNLDV